jgi:hypothetical protein
MPYIWFDKDKKIQSVTETKDKSTSDFIFLPFFENIKSDKTTTILQHRTTPFGQKLYIGKSNKPTTERFSAKSANQAVLDRKSYTRNISFLESPTEWSLQEIMELKYRLIAENKGYENFWFDELFDTSALNKDASDISTSIKGTSILPGKKLETNKLTVPPDTSEVFVYVESDRRKSLNILYKTKETDEFTVLGSNCIVSTKENNLWLQFKNIDTKSSTPIVSFGLIF